MKKKIAKIVSILLAAIFVISMSTPTFAYSVQKGDTLSKLAKANKTTVENLMKMNNLTNRDKIYIGQKLTLPNEFKESNALSASDMAMLYSMFDAAYYAKQNPDVVKVFGTTDSQAMFNHFLKYGLGELRQPSASFNVAVYAAAYNDLSKAFGTDVLKYYRHEFEYGQYEGRKITTIDAMVEEGMDPVLATNQGTYADENGMPQFNAFYENSSKTFVAPEAPANNPVSYDASLLKAAYKTADKSELVLFYGDLPSAYSSGYTVYSNPVPVNATAANNYPWSADRGSFRTITIDSSMNGVNLLCSTAYMFFSTELVDTFNHFEYLDVSNVTSMNSMFYSCSSEAGAGKTAIGLPNVSNWNTAKVTDMSCMFMNFGSCTYDHDECHVPGVPDVSRWNTAKVVDFNHMFAGYAQYDVEFNSAPNVSNWNTISAQNMEEMFRGFGDNSGILAYVPDVSRWNVSNVTNMKKMFLNYGYSTEVSIPYPDFSGWNTAKVRDFTEFMNCFAPYTRSLTDHTLDLSPLALSQATTDDMLACSSSKAFAKIIFGPGCNIPLVDSGFSYGFYTDQNSNSYSSVTSIQDAIGNLAAGEKLILTVVLP